MPENRTRDEQEGGNLIQIRVEDATGNVRNRYRNINFDFTPPQIETFGFSPDVVNASASSATLTILTADEMLAGGISNDAIFEPELAWAGMGVPPLGEVVRNNPRTWSWDVGEFFLCQLYDFFSVSGVTA